MHVIVISFALVASILFHGSKPKGPIWWHNNVGLKTAQKVFLWVDTFTGISLIALNLLVFRQKAFPILFWYAMILAIVALFILFFKTKEQEYDFYHGLWHFLASIVTLLAIVA